MNTNFYDALAENPVIAATKNQTELLQSLQCEQVQVVFLLFGDICNLPGLVQQIKQAGKIAIVHADLVYGLASKEIGIDFIKQYTVADGIISTRQGSIRRAKELGLSTVLRVFVLDSLSLASLDKLSALKPDFIEILPGTTPKTIRKICARTQTPILAGGLIADKEDVMGALEAGALAISSTKPEVWQL